MTAPLGDQEPGALPGGTFRIDREGLWHHEGQEVTHPGVLGNLYANLRIDAEGHFLQVGPRRIPVEVDDAPFLVGRVELPPDQRAGVHSLRAYLSDGSHEPLAVETIWIGPHETPYCRVKEGRFTARLAIPAWLQLARLVEEEPGRDRLTLVLGERRVPLPRRP